MSETTMTINCELCNAPLQVEQTPIERINAGTMSALVWTHKTYECPRCKATIVGCIAAFDVAKIQFAWMAIAKPPEEGLIKPATNLDDIKTDPRFKGLNFRKQ